MVQDTQTQSKQSQSDMPLVALFRHNLWANVRLLDACATLDEQQLAAIADGTFGSIYDTLKHIVGAEQSYLRRLTAEEPENPLRREDNPDVAGLCAYARQSGEGLIAVAARVSASDVLQLEWDGYRWPVPAGLILTQALNHATEHRSQVMTIMTQQGVQPPSLSGWSYIEEHITPTPLQE